MSFFGGVEKMAQAGANVASTALGTVADIGKGFLGMLFPEENSTPFDIIGQAGKGTIEGGGKIAGSVVQNAPGFISGGVEAAVGAVKGVGDVVGKATEISNAFGGVMASPPVNEAGVVPPETGTTLPR